MRFEPPFDRITVESGKQGGQPCIRGTRLTAQRVIRMVAAYPSKAELFAEYPELEEEDPAGAHVRGGKP